MILTLPNYLTQNPKLYQLVFDETFVVSKSQTFKKETLSLRNSTHMAILLIDGSKVLHVNDKELKVNESEVLFLAQGNYFMTEKISSNNAYESILICFDDAFVLNFLKKYKLRLETQEQESLLCIKKDLLMHTCVQSINTFFTAMPKNALELLKLKTEELFLYSLSKNTKPFLAFLNSIVTTEPSRIKYILESNLDIIFSVEEMCKLTRLSEKSLRKEMLRLYQQNPKKWLDTHRLKQAALLLKETKEPISTVATHCGYASVSWFVEQFKKQYKTTPSSYREENL